MAVIRRADAEQMARGAVVLDLVEVRGHADGLLDAARTEAANIIAEARARAQAESAAVRADARERGHAEGLEAGRAEGHAEALEQVRAEAGERLAQIEQAWRDAIVALDSSRAQLLAEAKDDLVRLALAIAEAVVRRVVAVDDQVAVRGAAAAAERVLSRSAVVIRVHPDDERATSEWLAGVLEAAGASPGMTIIADEAISRGSCRLHTGGGGVVDATVETQLARIAQAVLPGRSTALSDADVREIGDTTDAESASPEPRQDSSGDEAAR